MRVLHQPALIARLAETWFRRPASPTRLVLDVTRRCNLQCKMCHTWNVAPAHELSVSELRHILRQMDRLTWMDVTGGEPFLRADVAELFAVICETLPSLRVLHFPTNGWFTAQTLQVVKNVRAQRPDVELIVTVSLDGPPEVHDAMRGRPGSFQRGLKTFRALREVPGVHTYVGTTLTRWNEAELDALGALLAAEVPGFSSREWHWNWLQVSEHFYANEGADAAPRGAAQHLLKQVRRRGMPRNLVDAMELLFLVNLSGFQRGERAGMTCQALRSSWFISPEGDVYPCLVYGRRLGNLREQSVKSLWDSAEVARARRDIERLACGGCFTPCEAYPMLAGAPLRTLGQTARRAAHLLRDTVAPAPP